MGAVDLDAVDPETQRRFGPPYRAKPTWPRHGLPLPHTPEPRRQLLGARAQPVGFRRWSAHIRNVKPDVSGTGPTPTECRDTAGEANTRLVCFRVTGPHLSPHKQSPGLGTQSEFDRFRDGLPTMTGPGLRNRLPGRSDGFDPTRTPEAVLMDTVARLKLEVEAMKFGPPGHQTLGRPTSPV